MALPSLAAAPSAAAEVNLYSYRQPFLIEPILAKFTEETGIEVNVVFAKKGMIDKIRAAGENNPADAIPHRRHRPARRARRARDSSSRFSSSVLEANIPSTLRHPDGLWFGLTTRARVVFAHVSRVGEDEVVKTSDLADPRFKGRVCSRSGKHGYNVAFLAAVIAREGEEAAEKWLRGVKANLARKPQGQRPRPGEGDPRGGSATVALGNTYLHGQDGDEQEEAGAAGLGRAPSGCSSSTRTDPVST